MEPLSRTRDAQATRAAILDAAEGLFAEHGFDATPLAQVARSAGVTKSLIHHHFGSKEQLWQAVADRRFEAYGRRQGEILARRDLDVSSYEESIREFFRFLSGNPEFVRLHAWANAAGRAHDTGDLARRGVVRLRELQERGALRDDVDPASILVAFFCLVEYWFQGRSSLEERFGALLPEDSTYLEDLVRVLIRGIRP